uniref:XLF-like N-terminal domain-containing protein n=1 Tax=Trichogramma kaykai TaxID=54128 RepID=A0ABD2W811_9HYME
MSDTEDFNFLDYSHKYQALNINGSKFLIGVCKKNGSRNIILTNLKDFYKENIFKETIVSRCQDLNPAFEEHNVEEKVDSLLLDIPKYATTCSLDRIELESKIYDARFCMITEKFSKEVFETKLKNDKPLDKINVFLEVMNYNKTAKQIAKLEVQDVEKKDIEPKVTTKNCSKRKSSCVLRCAPPPTQLSRASNIQNTKKAEFQL